MYILDSTDLLVTLSNENYEGSGVTSKGKDKGKPAPRGYKLVTLASLLGEGALITAIAWGAIQEHDIPVTADMLRTTPHLNTGDSLLHDRGFLDAATITHLKTERQVDVCTGLKSDMLLMRAATAQANAKPGDWRDQFSTDTKAITVLIQPAPYTKGRPEILRLSASGEASPKASERWTLRTVFFQL